MTDFETSTAALLLAVLIGLLIGYPLGICHGSRVRPVVQLQRRTDKFSDSEG